MRLLVKVPGAVLWLFRPEPAVERNLAREARRRGVDPRRLVFAERLTLDEHLARHRLADLFLDTFTYNAHTTASDALWAGLPLVTKTGRGFPARVAASLLTTLGLSELITPSVQDYEALALALATDPGRLNAIKAKLLEARAAAPLFDTERFARVLEDAYARAYDRWFQGDAPGPIEIAARQP